MESINTTIKDGKKIKIKTELEGKIFKNWEEASEYYNKLYDLKNI